jgi:hypothetical protein
MNRCHEIIKKVLLTEEQNVAKQEDILSEFRDDLDIVEKSIQNFTMNYQQSMSMLESKHIQNNQQLDQEIKCIKQRYLEQRYQIQGENHQTKKNHEQRVYGDLLERNKKIEKKTKEDYDHDIYQLTVQKNSHYNNLENKITQFLIEKNSEIEDVKHDIELFLAKKEKDISTIILTKEIVEPADPKILKGIELDEAKEKRREYHKRRTDEIDMIFNITKHYDDKIIEKEAIISKINIEKRVLPSIWKKEAKIEETTLEHLIKDIENKKSEFIEQSQIEHHYLEKRERDGILFEEEETIETLKESQINESFDLECVEYKRYHDRNDEITTGSQMLHEFHMETNQSVNVFLETLINSTHSIISEIFSFEMKRLDMQMELLIDLLNQHFVNLHSFVTREIGTLKTDLSKNQSYLDYESRQYEEMYEKSMRTLIKESSIIIQSLKKRVEDITGQMKQLYHTISKDITQGKQKEIIVKDKFYGEMNETKIKHHQMIMLYRRNYIYKIEQQFALQKALKFKSEAKPIGNKVIIHQKAERLFDKQIDAMNAELAQSKNKTAELARQIELSKHKTIQRLQAELDRENKILQDLLEGNNQMVVRQKHVLQMQLENQRRQEIAKI